MSRKLILIKHAAPLVEPGKPSDQWGLSDAGRAACGPLAERLGVHQLSHIVSSEEPKARETAELLGKALNLPLSAAPGLHEHDRSNVPHLRSGEFISMMELMFRRPRDRVLGLESAQEAEERFAGAVADVLEQHPDGNIAIVSHGTVIALFAARHGQDNPFQLWRRMGLPSFLVMNLPGYDVAEVVESIVAKSEGNR
jgi:2,3-bisphosphoglycerate-dependent phosphoglycerate mutase